MLYNYVCIFLLHFAPKHRVTFLVKKRICYVESAKVFANHGVTLWGKINESEYSLKNFSFKNLMLLIFDIILAYILCTQRHMQNFVCAY